QLREIAFGKIIAADRHRFSLARGAGLFYHGPTAWVSRSLRQELLHPCHDLLARLVHELHLLRELLQDVVLAPDTLAATVVLQVGDDRYLLLRHNHAAAQGVARALRLCDETHCVLLR